MREVTHTVYKFDELDSEAKEKAREWYRGIALQDEWWESCYEDFAQVAEILGIDLRQKSVKLMNGETRFDPAIYFSGFCSQGDGACFEGTYSYAKGSVKAIKKYAPEDKELHAIAESLFERQRHNRYQITANIQHSGRYCHSHSMNIGVDGDVYAAEVVQQAMRDFADWMYERLEQEHEYQLSDECVDEAITANEYEFHADGEPA